MALSKLNAAGLAQFDGDLAFDNGNGIDFSASEGSGASSSVLDDYEEGTATLTMGGGTSNPSSTQSTTGYYAKVGNFVTIWFIFSAKDNTGASGIVEIDGLPFAVNSQQDGYGAAWGGRDSVGDNSKIWLALKGTSSAKLVNGSGNNVTWSTTGTGTYQGGAIHYRTS